MLAYSEIILRLGLAALLGAAVGLERERLEWVAGLRTHMLVCVGSALIILVSAYGFQDVISAYRVVLDPSRIAAQVVSGIGFLGAGTILFLRQQVIRGLTTAASLWTVAAVGLAVGSGLYLAAVSATALILVILAIVKPLERRLFGRDRGRRFTITGHQGHISLSQIESTLHALGLDIERITVKRGEPSEEVSMEFILLQNAKKGVLLAAVGKLSAIEGVRMVSV